MVARRWMSAFLALGCCLTSTPTASATDTNYIYGTSLDGVTSQLALDRTPALYTGDFGDCLGGQSLLNVTKFDAAFYYDNSTILFHLDGSTNIKSEALMLVISVYAYGQSRFTMSFDPCFVNIYSLCPMNATVPITAFALFQVGTQQISIPQIAYEIPDFEGFARIQIFANSSQTEIGCFQAVMRNGATFSQPAAISSILGIFTVVAVVASFATAVYGVSIPHMRTHYAHSLSVLVIFETFQAIFFSGALSVDWPSVLPAWWSNFAWSAGLIAVPSIVHAADSFAGVSGNASQVGGAGSTIINNNGGSLSQQIYGRSLTEELAGHAAAIVKREAYNASNPYDYNWEGNPVTPGMPIPADWSGFAGTLSELSIPGPDAFMVVLIWLLIILLIVGTLVASFKMVLEGLARLKWIKADRLGFFRSHWKGYASAALLRTLFIAFSCVLITAMFQFAHTGRTGPIAIAAIVFVLFVVGLGGLAAHALHIRLRSAKFASEPDRILFQRGKILGCIPFPIPMRLSQLREREFAQRPTGSVPFLHWHFVHDDPDRARVHQDEAYIKLFGWLFARYRQSRWWYFIFWLSYQFVRACFIGGATTSPLAQVFGLFIVDILSLVVIAAINPYEGQRNTALAVWLLGIAKVATTGLSVAFLPDFNIDRIVATVIGVIIIVIQAFLTIAVMILVTLGGISSWMSLTRNREYFSSERLEGVRIKYFEHIGLRALDEPAPLKTPKKKDVEEKPREQQLPEANFSVSNVRRMTKIEDEDEDYVAEITPLPAVATAPPGVSASSSSRPLMRASRTGSVSSRHSVSSLPRAARMHRASWSSRDFTPWHNEHAGVVGGSGYGESERPTTALAQRLNSGNYTPTNQSTANVAVPAVAPLRHEPSVGSIKENPATPAAAIPGSRPMTPAKEEVGEGEGEAEVQDHQREDALTRSVEPMTELVGDKSDSSL